MYKSFTSKAIFTVEWQVQSSGEQGEKEQELFFFLTTRVQNVMLSGQISPSRHLVAEVKSLCPVVR